MHALIKLIKWIKLIIGICVGNFFISDLFDLEYGNAGKIDGFW